MAKLDLDTDKLKECGTNIVNYSNDYSTLIDSFFDGLIKVTSDGVWVGPAANQFVTNAKNAKAYYKKLTDELKKYGNTVLDLAESVNGSCNNNRAK